MSADKVTGSFFMPKNCTVAADLNSRKLVLLILDHKLTTQKGYALTPEAAQQIAVGLTKNAEAVLAKRNTRDQPAAAKTSSVRPES